MAGTLPNCLWPAGRNAHSPGGRLRQVLAAMPPRAQLPALPSHPHASGLQGAMRTALEGALGDLRAASAKVVEGGGAPSDASSQALGGLLGVAALALEGACVCACVYVCMHVCVHVL